MKILLIYPPSRNIITTTQPKFIIKDRGFVPPLGLVYLASAIKEKTDHEVQILDCQVDNLSDKQIEDKINFYCPDVVGISVITFILVDSLNIAKIVKKIWHKIDIMSSKNKYISQIIRG